MVFGAALPLIRLPRILPVNGEKRAQSSSSPITSVARGNVAVRRHLFSPFTG